MKLTNVDIHVVQTSPVSRDIAKNAASAEKIVKGCKADLVLLPEFFLSGYQTESLHELALHISDPTIGQLAHACGEARVALILGFIERGESGQYYNSTLVIDQDGALRSPVRKTHLFGEERSVFEAGNVLAPVWLCGRQWGIINCFEVEFPEVARTLALQGAEAFLIVSANMRPYVDEHVLAVRARSKENRVPVAYANRIGTELGFVFCGRSMIVDHDGNVVHIMDESAETAVTASLTVGVEAAESVSMLEQLRPELYEHHL